MTTSKYGYALNFDWKHPWPRAPIPVNEEARLAELARYNIVDSEQDEKFDKLCRIACKEMKCPIAAVSFIDKQRQWFKANSGLTQKQIPRDVALCAHTIMHPKRALIVEDTSEDERFMNNPLVTRASAVRFYAGVPITTPNGFCIGSVFVFDVKSHQDVDAKILHKIAAKVLKYMDERLKASSGGVVRPQVVDGSGAPSLQRASSMEMMADPTATSAEQTPGEIALREQQAPPAPIKAPVKPPVTAAAPPVAAVPAAPAAGAIVPTEARPTTSTAIEVGGQQANSLGNMGSMLMNLLARTTETQQQLAAQQGVMFETLSTHSSQLDTLNQSMSKLERKMEEVRLKRQANAARAKS